MRSEANLFHKLPVRVSFAGLRGTTLDMVHQGWELTLMEQPHLNRYEREFRFYGFHKKLDLRCASGPMFTEGRIRFVDYVAQAEFPVLVEAVARQISVHTTGINIHTRSWDGGIGVSRELFSNTSMYGMGNLQEFTIPTHMIDELAQFSSLTDDSDLFIPKDKIWTVEEHLNAIREIQEPIQKEIRRKLLDQQEREKLQLQAQTKIYLVS